MFQEQKLRNIGPGYRVLPHMYRYAVKCQNGDGDWLKQHSGKSVSGSAADFNVTGWKQPVDIGAAIQFPRI